MSEELPSDSKKPHLVTQLSSKNTTARLASFTPRRDLTLQSITSLNKTNNGQSKRIFTPNLNVVRKKPTTAVSVAVQRNRPKSNQYRKNHPRTKRGNLIQTHGVFSEGLPPEGKEKKKESCTIASKPRISVKRDAREDAAVKELFKDDFLDDPEFIPSLDDIPVALHHIYSVESRKDIDWEAGYNSDETTRNPAIENVESDLLELFQDSDTAGKYLFEFPNDFLDEVKEECSKIKGRRSGDKKEGTNRLSEEGEGSWGFLNVHADGSTTLCLGNSEWKVKKLLRSKNQHLFSTAVDPSSSNGASIIYGGLVDAAFEFSLSFNKLT